jgi:hypothetical protein
MPKAAAGSAHHQPNAALSPMPASVMIESHQLRVYLRSLGGEDQSML